MSVRFIIGRAGSGKTVRCAQEIRAQMAADPLGGALFWITPEQATFTAERMLLTGFQGPGPRGSFRAQVVSFRRLGRLIARDLRLIGAGGNGKNAQPMQDLARLVLLEEWVREHRGELEIFAAVADRPGFLEKLDATLRELRQHGQTGEALRSYVAGEGIDAVTVRKVRDLALVLDGWEGVVHGQESWDAEEVLHRAALGAEASGLVTGGGGARIWVDGFSAMSALEIRLLVGLAQHAAGVTITLLADPESAALAAMRDIAGENADAGAFGRTERLHRRLVDAFRVHRVAIQKTEFLRERPRFVHSGLARIEAELFGEGVEGVGGSPRRRAATPATRATPIAPLFDAAAEASPGAEIWECSDPETEVRVAAQAVREMVTGAGLGGFPLRYREIGVIVPDLEGYQDALARIFTEHQIPHFIDQRRSIAHHPLVELLRSTVAIATGRWDRDEVLLYLKTGLAGVEEGDVAMVENYLLAHGIDHVAWSSYWPWAEPNQKEDEQGELSGNAIEMLRRVNIVRGRVWEDLRPWMEVAETRDAEPAAKYVRGLKALLERLKVQTQVEEWARAARGGSAAGDAELAQIHEQAWRQVEELLGMLEGLLAARVRSVEEFGGLLATALETMTLGLIPPTVDQVLISSVTRSRVPELKAVFILGAVEGQFPKVVEEDPILSDVQRARINAVAPEPIGAGSDRQLLEMPFFDYTAFTRASARLVVSYPLSDRRGRAVVKSRYIARLRDMFQGDDGAGLVERKFDAASRTDIERIGTLDDLLTGVVTWAGNAIRRRGEALEDGALGGLYNWLVESKDAATRAAVGLAWGAVGRKNPPRLSGQLAARFYPPGRNLRLSVSQLEKFAGCPLQYFMHYTLGLRPRSVLELDTLHLGLLFHRILERVYLRVLAGELDWPECEVPMLRRALEGEVDSACEELHAELAQRTPAYDLMKARTKRTLGIVLEGQRRRACKGDLRPAGVEVSFGGQEKPEPRSPRTFALPMLRIQTPAGQAVELSGKIDRVDASAEGRGPQVAVVDYKSASQKKLDLYWVFHGLALQLPVYAVVMEALAARQPIAAVYVPLGVARKTVKRPTAEFPSPGPDSDAFYQENPPRGLVDAAGAQHLDHAVGPHEDAGGSSAWYEIGYTKKGEILKNKDMVRHEDFTLVLQYVRWKIGTMTDALMQGQVAPSPYRDAKKIPCDQCDFCSLCPFDQASGIFRAVPKMKTDEVLARMRAAMGGEELR